MTRATLIGRLLDIFYKEIPNDVESPSWILYLGPSELLVIEHLDSGEMTLLEF
jgi:hypothetical protein